MFENLSKKQIKSRKKPNVEKMFFFVEKIIYHPSMLWNTIFLGNCYWNKYRYLWIAMENLTAMFVYYIIGSIFIPIVTENLIAALKKGD